MRLKDYLLLASFLVNIGLAFWLYSISNSSINLDHEVYQSKGRVEILKEQVSSLKLEVQSIEKEKDEVLVELSKKPKERVIIERIYEDEIDRVVDLPVDSALLYLSERLSKTNID
jgi:hypothetical protein